jgi:uncharacterized protein (TIGR00304 family)
MRPLRVLAAILIFAGAALTFFGVVTGEMQLALIVFVPVIIGSSVLGILAIGSIIAGFFVGLADLFLGGGAEAQQDIISSQEISPQSAPKKEFGGVVLIGPIPIVFGSSKKAAMYAMIVALVILALLLMWLFLSR